MSFAQLNGFVHSSFLSFALFIPSTDPRFSVFTILQPVGILDLRSTFKHTLTLHLTIAISKIVPRAVNWRSHCGVGHPSIDRGPLLVSNRKSGTKM